MDEILSEHQSLLTMADKLANVEAFPSDTDSERVSREVHSPAWWKLGTKDYSHVSIDGDYVDKRSKEVEEESVVKRRNSVFRAPEAVELYAPPPEYEGSHRFDPTLVWTEEEEKALVKKVSQYHFSMDLYSPSS